MQESQQESQSEQAVLDAAIAEALRAGGEVEQVAERFGVSQAVVMTEGVKAKNAELAAAVLDALHEGAHPKEVAQAAGMSEAAVLRIAKSISGDLSYESVKSVVEPLAKARPLRYTTYGAIACALGSTGRGGIAVGRALAKAGGSITPLEGALVLKADWRKPEEGGYLIPYEEQDWLPRDPQRRSRFQVLTDEGAPLERIIAGHPGCYLVRDADVITSTRGLREASGL